MKPSYLLSAASWLGKLNRSKQPSGAFRCIRTITKISEPRLLLEKASCYSCGRLLRPRLYSTSAQKENDENDGTWKFQPPQPKFDFAFLCDPANTAEIESNIKKRKGIGDIHIVLSLWKQFQAADDPCEKQELLEKLDQAAADIPNTTHPEVPEGDESEAKLLEEFGKRRKFSFTPKTVVELGETLDILRTGSLNITTGPSTYYLKGALAQLEQALIRYTLDVLRDKGFKLVTVPDLIHPSIIEGCGFKTTGLRTQVYKLDPQKYGDICLAGTGEMPLAGYFMNKTFEIDDLPQRVCTISRCYRAETSDLKRETGIYRVHQFTKVEMFAVTANETGTESERVMEDIRAIQTQLFSGLQLPFRVLDMPTQELGAPACRKYDMESWMPAKEFWGEISSTSNCLDYQSRRLNIQYHSQDGWDRHCHTVNGTGCAVPRMLMTILENNQTEEGSIDIPPVLHPYMNGKEKIERPENPLKAKYIKLGKKYRSRKYDF